jgi:hypothetical protein
MLRLGGNMKKLLIISSLALATACGGTEVIYVTETTEASTTSTKPKTTTTLATTPPLATRPPAFVPEDGYQEVPNYYDPDGYDTFIWTSVRDFWWLFTTDELLQMGLLVCEEFDRGSTLDEVSFALAGVMMDTNTAYLAEGLAAVTAGALTFLCPEHGWWLETI